MIASAPITHARFISVARSVARKSARAQQVVRASQEGTSTQTPEAPTTTESSTGATYFYGGRAYNSQAEWQAAVASGAANRPEPIPRDESEAVETFPSIPELFAFNGAPEIINGRLAMLAVLAALSAELASGESVLYQFREEPTGVIMTAATFAVASLIPMLENAERKPWGIFTPQAEMLNGRAAMLGFAALLAIEAVRGSALLG